MKITIVYDSLYGNTEKIGMAVKAGVGSEHEVSVFRAGDAKLNDIKGTGLLFVGSPTHGGWYSEPVKGFLGKLPEKSLQGIKAAAFDTCSTTENQSFFVKTIIKLFSNAAPRLANALKAKGAEIVGTETFGVKGKEGPLTGCEADRAQKWAKSLVDGISGIKHGG